MILIIGGTYQGKLEFARQLKGTYVTVSDGRTISLDLLAASDMITHFHEVIRRLWLEKREISAVIEEVLAKNPDITIVMDEIGYGVVPMSAEDREYRELVGHTGQLLARQAEAVYRVVCGIGTRIK